MVYGEVVDLPDEIHTEPVDDAAQQHERHGLVVRAGTLPEDAACAVGGDHSGDQGR